MDAISRKFQHFRTLLNTDSTQDVGVWSTTAPRQVYVAQFGLVAILCLAFAAVVVPRGIDDGLWNVIAFGTCAVLVTLPGWAISVYLERKHSGIPDSSMFLGWTLSAVATGLPAAHIGLSVLARVRPIGTDPFNLAWMPELFLGAYIAYTYWRLLLARQWQFRLDTERLKREAAEQGQALALAQLKMLQTQIEPHFLFNTLASVQHLVRKDALQADYMLGQLIRYLREATPQIHGMGSTLGRELGLVGAYLNINKIRMGNRLTAQVSIPASLAEVPFPSLIIQTLVENAIKHGVEPKSGTAKIAVGAAEFEKGGQPHIQVIVEDDGVGFGVADTVGTGVGLRNVRERLAGLYGGQASLDISSTEPHGVRATITFPRNT